MNVVLSITMAATTFAIVIINLTEVGDTFASGVEV
jgi:hypothetical protein